MLSALVNFGCNYIGVDFAVELEALWLTEVRLSMVAASCFLSRGDRLVQKTQRKTTFGPFKRRHASYLRTGRQ